MEKIASNLRKKASFFFYKKSLLSPSSSLPLYGDRVIDHVVLQEEGEGRRREEHLRPHRLPETHTCLVRQGDGGFHLLFTIEREREGAIQERERVMEQMVHRMASTNMVSIGAVCGFASCVGGQTGGTRPHYRRDEE